MTWDDDVIQEMKALFDTGDYSFGMMARVLNTKFKFLRLTRNACIGKARRLGWQMPEGKKQALIEHTKPSKKFSIKSGPAKPKKPSVSVVVETPKLNATIIEVSKDEKPSVKPPLFSSHKSYADICNSWRNNQCRYIKGEECTDEIVWACEETQKPSNPDEPKCSWCEYHFNLFTRRSKKVDA